MRRPVDVIARSDMDKFPRGNSSMLLKSRILGFA